MRIASHLVYLVAGISALYVVLAPELSDMPNRQPIWMTSALWCGAILLLLASLITGNVRSRLAALGGGTIVALYLFLTILSILARHGYYRVETKLVATREPPLWRYTFDKPMLVVLIVSGLISLLLALRSMPTANSNASGT